MEVYFLRSMGKYKRFTQAKVPDKLGEFYIKARIAERVEAKMIDKSQYQTKVMRPAPVADQYDGLTLEQLRQIAADRGIQVHHRSGVEKIKELLKGQ